MVFFPQTLLNRNELRAPKKLFGSFTRDECGGITIFVLVLSVLMLVVGGMAVDFQRQESARADLQNALDRGILAATNSNQNYDSSGLLSVDEQASQLISDYLGSRNFKFNGLNVSAAVSQVAGGRSISASADEPLNTIFLRMIGLETMNVAVNAGAIQAAPKLEISLVLDVSGSMGWDSTSAPGTKLDQLKIAAKEFIDIILAAGSETQTLISIVPFSQQVNLPSAMADQYNFNRVHNVSSCFDFHGLDFLTTAMPLNPGTPYQQGQDFSEWSGNRGCPQVNNAITAFSNNANDLKNAIDALQDETWTATYMGMKWGAAMLDPSSRPIISAKIASGELPDTFAGWPLAWNDPSVLKVTVLMSDGQNTRLNEINGKGKKYAVIDNDSRGDPILADICAAAKTGANSIIYTIGFELAGQATAIAALNSCRTNPSTSYLVDGLDLSAAFANIADDIVNLKLIN
jgi:Flp pilus assembly protein TadG